MITSLVYLVVYIIVLALIVGLLHYLIDAIPIQEPFNRWAKLALLVVSVLIIIFMLLDFVGVVNGGSPRLGK